MSATPPVDFSSLQSDGTPAGTRWVETRAIPGEELWWPPGTTAGVVVTPETALRSAPILTAHITVAMDTGITPLRVMREGTEGFADEQRNHPLRPLLRRTPDGIRTPSRFRAALMGHALSYRGGFAEIVRRGDGRPGQLVLLDPRLTEYQRGPTGRPGYRSGQSWIPADDILHVAGFGFDGLNGYQIPYLIAQAVGVTLGAESYAADFFANGSDPGGAIELPGKFDTREKLEQFRSGIEDRHQGPGKRHRVAVIQNGGKWVRTGTDPEAAQLTETRKYQATDSTRPYRVPPHKYGDYGEAHLANLDASNVDYLQTALMSWFVGVEEEFSLKLLSEREWMAGYRLMHDLEALLRGDPLKRYQCHEIAVRNGWRSRNDVRRREGDRPIPVEHGGDLYTIQQQVIPLAMSGQALAGPDPDAAKEPDPGEAAENEPPYGKRSALRYNKNHGKDGRFTSGKSSGGLRAPVTIAGERITPERAAEMRSAVQDAGQAKGEDWDFKIRPANARGGEKNVLKAASAEGNPVVVARQTSAVYREEKQGDIREHTVAGETAAETRPNPQGDGWISRRTMLTHDPSPNATPGDQPHATKSAALASSRLWAYRQNQLMTRSEYTRSPSVERAVSDIKGFHGGGEAGKWRTSFSMLRPRKDKNDRTGPPGESRFNPYHDAKGRFARKGAGKGLRGPDGQPTKIRGEDHAALIERQQAERRELGADLRADRREFQRDQAADAKQFARDQTKETKDFDRQQQKDAKDFDRQQQKDAKEFARDQQRERDEMTRDVERGDADPDDATRLQHDQAAARKDFEDATATDRADFKASQNDEAAAFKSQQERDLADFRESQRDDYRDHRQQQRDQIHELISQHRDDQAALLRDLRDSP